MLVVSKILQECPSDFEYLISLIAPRISHKTQFRKSISTGEKLAVSLRYLTTIDSFQSIMHLFGISNQSVSNFVPEVLDGQLLHLETTQVVQ